MMDTKIIRLPLTRGVEFSFKSVAPVLLFAFLLFIWCFAPGWITRLDPTTGSVDQGIWLLVLLSLISFLLITALCWWLLKWFWSAMGLPSVLFMVSQFNSLKLWQQLGFYWVSFVSLLWAALGCLIAIC